MAQLGLKNPFRDGGVIGLVTLLIVLISAIPLGSNRPMWWVLLSGVICLIFAVQVVADLRRGLDRPARAVLPLAILYLAVLAWAYVQASFDVDPIQAHPVWSLVPEAPPVLAADPIAALHHLLRLTAYGMVFWIALRACRSENVAEIAVRCIAIAVTALATYGIFAVVSGNNPVLGALASDRVSATFVNRNNFATFAVIGVLANLTVCARLRPDTSRDQSRRLLDFLEGFFQGGWIFATGILICLAAIVLSESRAGLAAMIIGLSVYALTGRRRGAQTSFAALFVVALVGFSLVALSSGVFARIFTTEAEEARFAIYPLVIDGILDRPLAGHGLGGFLDAFRIYVPLELSALEIDLAHNSYLENLFELGLPMGLLFYLVLAALAVVILRGTRVRRRNRRFTRFASGAIAACAFHAFFDFSLQIPAVAALFAFVLGLGWAQAFRRPSRQS